MLCSASFFCNPHLFFCCCDYDIMKIYLLTQKRYRLLYPSVILWLPKAMESFEAISYLHVAFMSNISDSKKHNATQVLSHQPTIRGDIEMLWSFRHERLIQKAAGLVRLNWIFFLYRVINLSDNYCLLLFLRFFIVLIWTAQPPAHISKWQQKVIKYIYRTKLRLFTQWAWCDDCFFNRKRDTFLYSYLQWSSVILSWFLQSCLMFMLSVSNHN
jgi:hypothetical protein